MTILKLKSLPIDNPRLRLDSQFHNPSILKAIQQIRQVKHIQVGGLSEKTLKGRNVEYSEFGNVPIIRSGDINQLFDNSRLLYADDLQPIFFVKQGDVLISSIGFGSIGKVQLFNSDKKSGAVGEVTIIRQKKVEPAFLAAFLTGKFGQMQIERWITGATGQLHLYPSDVDQIYVPIMGVQLQQLVDNCYNLSSNYVKKIKEFELSANRTLFSALGLADWNPPEPLTYIASSADAFAAGRLDAQYFQPKFDDMHARIKMTGGAVLLSDVLSLNVRGRQPLYAEEGMQVVNSKHVRTNRVILDSQNRFGLEESSPIFIEQGDVLVNGTGVGTIGRAAPYIHTARALPDNHVTVLRSDMVDPIYLSVFLNSRLGQLQIERFTSGSSGQVELYPSDIGRIFFWNAPQEIQLKIRGAILSALDQERRARELLEAAKRAVEIAIEENEAAALRYLKKAGA